MRCTLPALVATLLFLMATAPLATADVGLPAPLGDTERVTRYWWSQDGASWCESPDRVIGTPNAGALSSLTHTPAADVRQYDLHLETLLADAGCPTLDISFVSSADLRAEERTSGSATSACGASGWVTFYAEPTGRFMFLDIYVPETCGAGVAGRVFVLAKVQPIQPSTYVACVPVELSIEPCAGAVEYENDYSCHPNGRFTSTTYVVPSVRVDRTCDYETSEDYVLASAGWGFVEVEAREDSCTIRNRDFFIFQDQNVACPAELGAAIYGLEWGNLLP